MKEKAYLAMGCFWGPDEYFSHLKGVTKTQVGYSGGDYENPTYHDLGDNSETIEIEFDPEKISYRKVLEDFFSEHNLIFKEESRYRSAIFYLSDTQKKEAEKVKKEVEEKLNEKVTTSIESFKEFTIAEEYHQKYFQKNKLKS